jgi:hypothetical protein
LVGGGGKNMPPLSDEMNVEERKSLSGHFLSSELKKKTAYGIV